MHEYKDTWVSVVGEELCRRDPTNQEDRFGVTITKDSSIVGHMPNFLQRSGSTTCRITVSRQYSHELPQEDRKSHAC